MTFLATCKACWEPDPSSMVVHCGWPSMTSSKNKEFQRTRLKACSQWVLLSPAQLPNLLNVIFWSICYLHTKAYSTYTFDAVLTYAYAMRDVLTSSNATWSIQESSLSCEMFPPRTWSYGPLLLDAWKKVRTVLCKLRGGGVPLSSCVQKYLLVVSWQHFDVWDRKCPVILIFIACFGWCLPNENRGILW